MSLIPTESTPRTILTRCDNWAFKIFLCSTLFIIVFSIEAIHSWPSLLKHASVLLACLLPTVMVVLSRAPIWFDAKQLPKEVLWVLLVFILGLTSSLLSENPWVSLKSTVLFMASGPFIFIATRYLFESTRNQNMILWMTSLCLLALCFYGIYEYKYSETSYLTGKIRLFSENTLPAGALLVLLSASPMALLSSERSTAFKMLLALSLLSTATVIILMFKKGPILGLISVLLFLVVIKRKYFKFLLGFIFISGTLLFFSNSTFYKYKAMIGRAPHSVLVRAESYFFGFHVFKKNPVLGVGSKADLVPYLDDYRLMFSKNLSKIAYQKHVAIHKTLENIGLAFLIEYGGLFFIAYFGGILYFLYACCYKLRSPLQTDIRGMFIVSAIVGFAAISLTFDTLRFPNLNWLFHSFLGLLLSLPNEKDHIRIKSS
jgi:hypothetical protein